LLHHCSNASHTESRLFSCARASGAAARMAAAASVKDSTMLVR
jgi:hypothetical protein